MRSLEDASASWQELKRYTSLTDLKEAVRLDGGHVSPAASAGLRSASWKAFLIFESLDTASWPKTLAASRSAYNSLRTHFLRHLENPDELSAAYDPLSEDSDPSSPCAIHHKDEELRAEIQQDVDRCMPENLYFRQPETQRTMLDILFVWCKLNPDLGYRQGMHELLAPILWVVERDAIDLGPSSKALGEDATVRTVFDAESIEHDSFALFAQLMQSAKGFYEQTTHQAGENPIVRRSQRIFNELLPQVDPQLAEHLHKIDIVPQIFLMRWIRLLFGREFPFDDILPIWDVLFAEDTTLELVDHTCLAMLLRIRWDLLEADYNAALTLLLRYPEPSKDHPAQTFVLDALYLRKHLDTEGSGYLILKYTGRPLQPSGGAVTPPALQRNITTFSGIPTLSASTSPSRPSSGPRQRTNLEAMLQSTARNIYAKGGQAVRSAVDEVHKRAQEIRETQTPSLPPRAGAGTIGVASSRTPAALYQRISALERRNQQLGRLLEGAVGSLWEYQRLVAESGRGHGVEEKGRGRVGEEEEVERLSVAIAKVQFAQVYLEDASLPLPLDSEAGESEKREAEEQGGSQIARLDFEVVDEKAAAGDSERVSRRTLSDEQASTSAAATTSSASGPADELADPSTFDFEDSGAATPATGVGATASPPRIMVQGPSSASQTSQTLSQVNQRPTTPPPPSAQSSSPSTSQPRPLLAESSYSWMLGQDDHMPASKAPGVATTSSLSPSSTTSSASTTAMDRNRTRAGYLFGDTGDANDYGGGEGGAKEVTVRSPRAKGRKHKASLSAEQVGVDGEGEGGGFDMGMLRGGGGGSSGGSGGRA